MGRAVALQKLGQDDAALAAYESVLNNDPKNLEALTNMLGLLKKKDPKLAIEKLGQLRETYPYNADITAQLGIAYGSAGQFEDALKYLDMAEALSPGSASVLYNRAVLYDRMGRAQQAGDLYRQIVRMAAEGNLDQTLPLEAIRRRLAVLH
jgi:tetratricopeptide (TPR) repeat protein